MTMLAPLLGRRAFVDYARRPLNLVLLVVVPVVMVFVWGGTLADFSRILGGVGPRPQLEAATAGWAASALAGLAGFFQVSGNRGADRRLTRAAGHTSPVLLGRVGTALGLAVLAAIGGLAALGVRSGIVDPPQALAATVMITVIYVSLGILVGTVVRSEMNGALLITLVWVFDVFFGPLLGPGQSVITRLFPIHYPTLLLMGQSSGHAGPLGDLGWSLLWTVGLSVAAVARLATTIGPHRTRTAAPNTSTAPAAPIPASSTTAEPVLAPAPPATVVAGSRSSMTSKPLSRAGWWAVMVAGMREHRRNRVLWVLLVVVPAVFIGMAIVVTVTDPGPISLVEGSRHYVAFLSERRIHAAVMVPVTSAFLAGITGLFVITGSAAGDRRLVQSGFRPWQVLAGRVGVIGAAATIATVVAVAFSAAAYPPKQWTVFLGANLLVGMTYALLGVLVGPFTGRLGGLYLLLLLAFVDVGLGQNVMTPGGAPAWGAFLPARGATRVMIDGAFTDHFDQLGYLVLALVWLAGAVAATALVWRHRNALIRSRPANAALPASR